MPVHSRIDWNLEMLVFKIPNWQDRGFELGTTKKQIRPARDFVEALIPGPPDYNTSALNHSATLRPQKKNKQTNKQTKKRKEKKRKEKKKKKTPNLHSKL